MKEEDIINEVMEEFDKKYGAKLNVLKEFLEIPNLVPALSNLLFDIISTYCARV